MKDRGQDISPIDRVKSSRHPDRPYLLDYVSLLFSDFYELHGDRKFAELGSNYSQVFWNSDIIRAAMMTLTAEQFNLLNISKSGGIWDAVIRIATP